MRSSISLAVTVRFYGLAARISLFCVTLMCYESNTQSCENRCRVVRLYRNQHYNFGITSLWLCEHINICIHRGTFMSPIRQEISLLSCVLYRYRTLSRKEPISQPRHTHAWEWLHSIQNYGYIAGSASNVINMYFKLVLPGTLIPTTIDYRPSSSFVSYLGLKYRYIHWSLGLWRHSR